MEPSEEGGSGGADDSAEETITKTFEIIADLSLWYGWDPDDIFVRMSYEKAVFYWSRGFISEKMQALRIAGHMWGQDIDAEMEKKETPKYPETDYDGISMFFGVPLG